MKPLPCGRNLLLDVPEVDCEGGNYLKRNSMHCTYSKVTNISQSHTMFCSLQRKVLNKTNIGQSPIMLYSLLKRKVLNISRNIIMTKKQLIRSFSSGVWRTSTGVPGMIKIMANYLLVLMLTPEI